MRILRAAAGALALASAGCGSCGTPSAGPPEAAVAEAVEPPVPAPAGLLAEVRVREPDAAWGRIQRGVSGAVALLPPTVGELACGFAGLAPSTARLLDGKGTSYVVLGQGKGAEAIAWVAAIPVLDASAASSTLLVGADGAGGGSSSARDVAGMRLLTSAAQPPSVTVALARGPSPRGWLVLASSEEALASLGPYAVRTLPTTPPPTEAAAIVADVPGAALAGPVSTAIAARWGETRAWLRARDDEQRAKHGGRAPDFGDPRPIVEAVDGLVTRRIGLLAAARGAHVVLEAGEDEVHVEVALTPGTDAASAALLAAMTTGDTAPLAAAPAESAVVLLVRDAATGRGEDAASLESTVVTALGDRLNDEDRRAVHTALTDWVHARGDWWAGGLAWGASDPSRGLWVRTAAASPDTSARAVRELVDLSHRRAFADMLSGSLHLSPANVRGVDAPPVAKASLALFEAKASGGGPHRPDAGPSPGIAWGVQGDDLFVAAGTSAAQLLSAEAAPHRRVGDDPRTARSLAALGPSASFAVLAEPLRFDPTRSEPDSAAAAAFAWGRKGEGAWARLELADLLLRELLRLKAGL